MSAATAMLHVRNLLVTCMCWLATQPCLAQDQEAKIPSGYTNRDILSPFRNPEEIAAPPDALFAALRRMQQIADSPDVSKSFDSDGREIVDDDAWRAAFAEVSRIGIDAGMLAAHMRTNRSVEARATAFYATFFCDNVDYVFNLISHIPGEPQREIRERAYPRAIAFLKANLGRRFGHLPKEARDAIVANLPAVGSPAARARGITRAPKDDDLLHSVYLVPFFQLLDLDDQLDQAQGLWFVKETCLVRKDLALGTLEPVLARIRQLLGSKSPQVRREAFGVFCAIADPKLAQPDPNDSKAADAFAIAASKSMFPPLRRISEGLMVLQKSEEREALVAAAIAALSSPSTGKPDHGTTSSGAPYRGFRIESLPAELEALGIPEGCVVTAVNGMPIHDGQSLRSAVEAQFWFVDRSSDTNGVRKQKATATILVEYQQGDTAHAMEFRIL